MVSSACKLALLLLVQSAGAVEQGSPDSLAIAPVPSGPQRVEGRVVRPGNKDMVSAGQVWVTLHRVGSDHAAPLDSALTSADGRYKFGYERSGDPEAIYFVSAMYSGIAYFTPPLREAVERGEHAEIVVFDTTSRQIEIGVRGHHVIVSSTDANQMRSITEVFELANDSARTLVGSSGLTGTPSWSTAIPADAKGFLVGQGDIPAAAVRAVNGRAEVYAPIAPGLRQISFTYTLPGKSFPLRLPVERLTSVYEVLLEDPGGTVLAPQLKEVDPVSIERRQFRRFLGSEVAAGSVTVIDVPPTPGTMNGKYLMLLTLVIGGAMLAALARAFMRR